MTIVIQQGKTRADRNYRPFDMEYANKKIVRLPVSEASSFRAQAAQEIKPFGGKRPINLGVPKIPVGNLQNSNPYALKKAAIKKSFLSIFHGIMLGGSEKLVPAFYQSIAVACYFKAFDVREYAWLPSTASVPGDLKKLNREVNTEFMKLGHHKTLVRVRKEKDHFVADVPLIAIPNSSYLKALITLRTTYQKAYSNALSTNTPLPDLPGFFLHRPEGQDQVEGPTTFDTQAQDVSTTEYQHRLKSHLFKIQELGPWMGGQLPVEVMRHFVKYTEGFYFREHKGSLVMMASFNVPAADMQSLTSSAYALINPHDVCGLFEAFVSASVGADRKKIPHFILPLPRVRALIPKVEGGVKDFRINEDGISIDPTGHFRWLPRELDTIDAYESDIQEFYRNEDGSYSSENEAGEKNKSKAISPRIVYVDWVNKKMAYTNRLGDLEVLDLDRYQPATVTHYARFFQQPMRKITQTMVYIFSALEVVVPMAAARMQVRHWDEFLGRFRHAIETQLGTSTPVEQLDLGSIIEALYSVDESQYRGDEILPAKRWEIFADACGELVETLERDPLLINNRFAVPVVSEIRAAALIISRHKTNDSLNGLYARDKEARTKYVNQGLDPNYQNQPIPFVKDAPDAPMFMLPHQLKMENFMRNSPDFALWGVDAGGGKTPLSVMNYLREMQQFGVKRAVVIAPNHLVSTHVQDITEFTQGRMNIIPITTYTQLRHGRERLQQMIDNSPINTIVIVSMVPLQQSVKTVAYGSTPVRIYWLAEWLRQFNFQYAVIDEIHLIRNESSRQRAVMRLIQGIKKIRGMSGTLIANQPQDLAPQLAVFDPTIFGSKEEFNATYGEETTSGGKVLKWKEGFEAEVNNRIRENVAYIQVLRKEWAAMLPDLHERFISVNMTPNQQHVYNLILAQSKEDAMKDPKILKILQDMEANRESGKDEEDIEDLEAEKMASLANALKRYIQRLERFVTVPAWEMSTLDLPNVQLLEGEDRVSPKLVEAGNICLQHLQDGIVGKIIIFCNYKPEAEEGAEYLNSLPGLQGRVIHYQASTSEADRSRFDKDPNALVLIGVSSSMDTGLNMQMASRLIRLGAVWTPGPYEQGNSRINRLSFKNGGEQRANIYIDTLVVNNSIDVTKSCYLMSKIIVAEKFKNSGNPDYDNIETPDLFKMTMDNIFSMNNVSDMQDWFKPYSELDRVRREEVIRYRRENPDLKLTLVPRAQNLEGSALMMRTPYDPGTLLYAEKDLGLVRYDHFLGETIEDAEEDGPEEQEDQDTRNKSKEETEKVRGLAVHTEFGDGEIESTSYSKQRLNVRMYATGEVIPVSKLSAFVITRANTNSKDMRLLLAARNPDLDVEARSEDLVPAREPVRKPKRGKPEDVEVVEDQEEASLEVALQYLTVNGMLIMQVAEAEEEARNAMRQFGFETAPDIVLMRIRSWIQFQKIIAVWAGYPAETKLTGKGLPEPKDPFRLSKNASDELVVMFDYIRQYGLKGTDLFDITYKNDFRMFKLKNMKPNADRRFITPFPFVMDNAFYVGMPVKGHAGTRFAIQRARNQVSPTPKIVAMPKGTLWKYLGSKSQVKPLLKDIVDAGFTITNLKELGQDFKSLRVKKSQV